MAVPLKKVSSADSLSTISNVLISAFVIAIIYFGRELLVPLALAALLTFMLAPLTTRLQRWLGRVGAVLVVVAMMFAVTGAIGWVLTRQAVDLAHQLPDYKENIRTKLRSIQIPDGGPLTRISEAVDDLKKDLPGGENGDPSAAVSETVAEPMPVTMVNTTNDRLAFMQVVLAPVLGPLGTAALVLLLLVFMLLERDDLRRRLIRLVGQGRISSTSRAMEDAGSRVSRYLLMLLVVNVTYGIAAAIGLYLIGVPNAILWGALACVLRFIPYVGPWIAASFPILLSLAVSPDWVIPLMTIGMFIVLELISNNVMEPLLYSSSTGVTPIALIVAALAWTWVWGPIGLVLATPLTVCLVVMGRHIPRLAFLSIMLSDEEALTPSEDLYHRLLRTGEHDETEFVEAYLKSNETATLFDSVLVPVVTAAETDHRLGLLEAEQLDFVEQGLVEILEELELRLDAMSPPAEDSGLQVCCIPAKAYRDELAGAMLAQLLRKRGHAASNASAKMVSGEWLSLIRSADVVCVSAVAPTTVIHARYLCSKVRRNLPETKIILCLSGISGVTAEQEKVLRESGADEIVTSIGEASERIALMATLKAPKIADCTVA